MCVIIFTQMGFFFASFFASLVFIFEQAEIPG